jgi:hypothetical protein
MSNELGLPSRIVETGLRVYDKFADRSKMPTNRRLFLESMLDNSTSDIDEKAFNPDEIKALQTLVFKKYQPLQPELEKHRDYLKAKLENNEKFKKAKNKDKMLYPEFEAQYKKDLNVIESFLNGKLTPEFVSFANGKHNYETQMGLRESGVKFNPVRTNIQYEDYPINIDRSRTADAGKNPFDSLATSLGRFNYEVDKNGNLVVKDTYDFNPRQGLFGGPAPGGNRLAESAGEQGAEAGPFGMYGLLRTYAGEKLPPGKGRNVRVSVPAQIDRLNNPFFTDSIGDTTR